MEKRLIAKIEGKGKPPFRENTNRESGVNSSVQGERYTEPDEGPVASAEDIGKIMGGIGG